jgi:hypothetical protein
MTGVQVRLMFIYYAGVLRACEQPHLQAAEPQQLRRAGAQVLEVALLLPPDLRLRRRRSPHRPGCQGVEHRRTGLHPGPHQGG